ncbi:MarR family winged helix-turn-helix transcriptional regulator [Kordiimonas laminariae]|uniref:MarR family winged helix-turn-helix transcriptional regulator n=1 Tax=Kordiimonas laminariae TaxID=2917717 RepID=UPI001FF3F868|nr:MarR family transcriptional regulator [Kordiimonas laminariae]
MDYVETFSNQLAFRLAESHRLVSELYTKCLKPLGLRPVQAYALGILKDRKLCTPSEIANVLGISRPSVSNLLNRMERDKLVNRVPDKSNKKQIWIFATPEGLELVEEAYALMGDVDKQLEAQLEINLSELKSKLFLLGEFQE